ncbi:MAG: hypothetical protein R3Y09_12630 [Clostridia bacterium]
MTNAFINLIFEKFSEIISSGNEIIYKPIFISIVAIVIVAIPLLEILKKLFDKKYYRKRNRAKSDLKNLSNQHYNFQKNGVPLIYNEWKEYTKIHNLHIDHKITNVANGKLISRLNLKESFILIGEAGSGKSTYLNKLFLNQFTVLGKIRNLILSRLVFFYSAEKFFDHDIDAFLKTIKYSNLKRIFIICDGVDELDESIETLNKIKNVLEKIHSCDSKSDIKIAISCRAYCQNRYTQLGKSGNYFTNKYQINKWTESEIEELIDMTKKIICKTNDFNLQQYTDDINNIFKTIKLEYTPMLFKLYSLILISGETFPNLDTNNKYSVYRCYITMIFKRVNSLNVNLDDSSEKANIFFKLLSSEAFWLLKYNESKGEITPNSEYGKMLSMIYDSKDKKFTHQTYKEFFVAEYYIHHLNFEHTDYSNYNLAPLSFLYSNECADFISDAIKFNFSTHEHKVIMLNRFINMYVSTLPKDKDLNGLKSYNLKHQNVEKFLNKTDLSKNELLLLKFEITFRVGRLKIPDSSEFLNWVFYNDNLLSDYSEKEFNEYQNTVLRRQCAISASLTCNSEIELEYVKKMLPYHSEYDEKYDLVNRSYTLVYYGDVLNENFISFEDKGGSWTNAKEKRIKRLSADASEYIIEDKIACFRLFDLATIYTFLSNRGIQSLTDKEFSIIKECNVSNIKNMPEDRSALMMDIKKNIIELVKKQEH